MKAHKKERGEYSLRSFLRLAFAVNLGRFIGNFQR